jgi:hypothetical protein
MCRRTLVASVYGLPYAYIYIYIYTYIYIERDICIYMHLSLSIYIYMHIWAEKLTARVRGKATVVWKSLR